MRVIDASSIVYAWDNYPIVNFPPLWQWIEGDCASGELCIPRPAFDEVEDVSPDCSDRLKSASITVIPVSNTILVAATEIKTRLGIFNDNYHPDGVDENDILIIATAQIALADLISNEGRQPDLPINMRKYKIPAVCAQIATVQCINFLDHIKQSGRQFG